LEYAVVARGTPLPRKLRQDAIVEALWEIQFETTTLPERLIGRISDVEPWKSFSQRRLPAYDIPAVMRQTTPQLHYAPIVEISHADEREYRALRLGPSVLSLHRAKRYVGWQHFRAELEAAATELFNAAETLKATRLGLRYLNALTPQAHNIRSIEDLDIAIEVANEPVISGVSLNFQVNLGNVGQCRVGIATPEYVQGPLPEGTTAYIDVDVYTTPGYECTDLDLVRRWLDNAHTHARIEFFHLLKQPTIANLWEN
jgi:uncharacterized protein (TIGR04255 family)